MARRSEQHATIGGARRFASVVAWACGAALAAAALGSCGVEACPPRTVEVAGICMPIPEPPDAGPMTAMSAAESDAGPPRIANDGDACEYNDDCLSNHCSGGICCRSGDCCKTAMDCQQRYASKPQCSNRVACQGSRQDAVCDGFECLAMMVPDDSGCGPTDLALACSGTPSRYCNGEMEQRPPLACERPPPPPPPPPPSAPRRSGSGESGARSAAANPPRANP